MKQEFLEIWNLNLLEGAVLNRFHLRMSRGDFVELLGTEGCGKEELADFFSGSMHIKNGYVKIGGGRYREGENLRDAGIMCIRSTPSLAGALSVAENIMLLSEKRIVRGIIRHRDLEARANFLLSEFGVDFRADTPANRLSEGEKRVVELLRAAENGVSLIVIDNIFESLGQADIQMIGSCLAELKKRSVTILVLGGRFPLFRDLDDRVIAMRAGRNVRTFFRDNFDREEFVKWVFGAPEASGVRTYATGELSRRSAAASQEEKNTVLAVEGFSGEYLQAFSCEIKRGEIVGLYDMNNRKNRELIRFLAGEENPKAGTAMLNGRLYKPRSVEAAVRMGTAYIPGSIRKSAVISSMSYGENLTLSVMRRNSTYGFVVNKRIEKFLEKEHGKELDAAHPEEMSAGELNRSDQMKVVLQRILLTRPSLLLAEDFLSDMNVRTLKIQTDYLASLTEAGCAVLLSSQNLMVLRQVCDRIIVMSDQDVSEGGHFHEIVTERSKKSPPFRKLH